MSLSDDRARTLTDQGGWQFAVQAEGAGPPVVLLHGLLTDSSAWDAVADELVQTNTVVRVDAPGHGSSPARSEPFSLEDESDALAAAIRSMKPEPPPVWIGHSMGGMKAMRIALSHPDLVSALVLISTQPYAEPERTARPYKAMVETALECGISEDLAQMIGKLNFGKDYLASSAGQAWVRHFSRAKGDDIAAMSHAVFGRGDIADRLVDLTVPVLVIHGSDDIPIRVRIAREWAARLPRGRLVELAGCGHSPPCEEPKATAGEIAAFLTNTAS